MPGAGTPDAETSIPVTQRFVVLISSTHPYTPAVVRTALKEGLQDHLQAHDLCVGTHISVLPL